MITKPAVPAENMMQAFIWYHLVPVERWNVVVSRRRGAKMPFQVVTPQGRLTLSRGGETILPLLPQAKGMDADQLHVQLNEPPEGIEASIITDDMGSFAIQISTSSEEVEPGLRGNLLISVYREYTPEPTESNPAPRARRTDYGFLPAIPYEVSKRKSVR
jgi:hypothetical protein